MMIEFFLKKKKTAKIVLEEAIHLPTQRRCKDKSAITI
jgi:hypothetical protein